MKFASIIFASLIATVMTATCDPTKISYKYYTDNKCATLNKEATKPTCFISVLLFCFSAFLFGQGGNGPHSGERNSSLGLAVLGKDRFAGFSGTGTFMTTKKVKVGVLSIDSQ